MQRFILNALAACFVCLAGAVPAAEGPVLIVINDGTSSKTAGTGSVALLHPETFETVAQVELGLVPGDAVLSPDQRLLYVFAAEKGAGPKGSVSVVEIPSGRLVAVVDAGEEPEPIGFAEGPRLFCLSRGAKNKKSIVTILGGADQARLEKIELPPGAVDGRVSWDGKRLYVLHARQEGKDGKDGTPVLHVVDIETKQVSPLPLTHEAAQMTLSADGRWLYVLDRGDGKKKEAAVFVIDVGLGKVAATLPAGSEPTRMRLHRSSGRLYVASRDPSDEKKGFVLGIQGAAVFAKLDLPERPLSLHLAPDASELRVVFKESVAEIDPDLGKERRRLPLKLRELVTADGQRRVILIPQGPAIPIPVGSVAEAAFFSLGAALGAGLRKANTVDAEPAAARRDSDGGVPILFDVFARRRDGKFLYGLSGNQLEVLDMQKLQVTQKLDLADGAYEVRPAANGRLAFVKSIGELALLDLYKSAIFTKYPLAQGRKGTFSRRYPRRELAASEARRIGLIADGKQVSVISLRTGELLKTKKNLPSPSLALVPKAVDAIGESLAAAEDAIDKALLFEAEGEPEQALAEYRKARTLAPGDWTPVERLVVVQLRAGKTDEAFAELKSWLETSPSNPTDCWRGAGMAMALKRHAEAVTLLQCALKSPEGVGVPASNLHVHLARSYLAANDPAAARRHAEQAKKLGNVAAGAVLREIEAKK